jgi:hypothetical protein
MPTYKPPKQQTTSEVTQLSRYNRLLKRAEDDIQTMDARISEAMTLVSNVVGPDDRAAPSLLPANAVTQLKRVTEALTVAREIASYYTTE